MTDEGNVNNQDQNPPADNGVSELKSELQQMQEQLANMNQSYQEQMQGMVDAFTKSQSQIDSTEDQYLSDEEKQIKQLRAEIQELKTSAPKQTQEILKRERDLNTAVVRLASDYPEIQSDDKIRQAVLDQHAKLPSSMKETAEGYELAVQRAVAKAGLVPKARRQTSSADADSFSSPGQKMGSSSSGESGRKAKVSEKTLAVAQLLGRDINDKNVLKGLEEATQRTKWNRYS